MTTPSPHPTPLFRSGSLHDQSGTFSLNCISLYYIALYYIVLFSFVWFVRVLDTCCSHILTIIAGVDLHFRHESELPVCRTRGLQGEAANHYTNDAGIAFYCILQCIVLLYIVTLVLSPLSRLSLSHYSTLYSALLLQKASSYIYSFISLHEITKS